MNPRTLTTSAPSVSPDSRQASLGSCLEELQFLTSVCLRSDLSKSPILSRSLLQIEIRLNWLRVQLHHQGLVPSTFQDLSRFLR